MYKRQRMNFWTRYRRLATLWDVSNSLNLLCRKTPPTSATPSNLIRQFCACANARRPITARRNRSPVVKLIAVCWLVCLSAVLLTHRILYELRLRSSCDTVINMYRYNTVIKLLKYFSVRSLPAVGNEIATLGLLLK